VFIFLVFVAFSAVMYAAYVYLGTRKPPIRRVAGLDAIDEAIGRATELGRPVHYTFGAGGFDSQMMASFGVLEYVAKKVVDLDTRIIVTSARPETHAVAEEIVRQAYVQAGRGSDYDPSSCRFVSEHANTYNMAVIGIIQREKVATNLMIGSMMGESIITAEAANAMGCLQVAATAAVSQLPFMVASCDYCLIGEELFAAGAYLSENRWQNSCIMAQELGKYVAITLIVIGAISTTVKAPWLINLLSM
jgi:hypothetical protein